MMKSRMNRVQGVIVGVSLALGALCTTGAQAYCRTTTCLDCERDEGGCLDGGKAVAWRGACIRLGLHGGAADVIDPTELAMLAEEAFSRWNNVQCGDGGRPPSIELLDAPGPILCGISEYVADSANANVVVFHGERWPYSGAGNELATTRVRFDSQGWILDADIEVNATRALLFGDSAGGGFIPGAHDLLSILVHEVGHFLGLDHSLDPDSVMQETLPPRVVRTELSADDIAAICAVYPPSRQTSGCSEPVRGEYSTQCALDPSTGGACTVATPGASHRGGGVGALILIGFVFRLRRRR